MTLEHRRAKFAHNKVERIFETLSNEQKKEFSSWAKKFPTMIQSCGLLQSIVFYKEKDKGKKLYQVLENWFREEELINNETSLIEYLLNNVDEINKYIKLQEEAINFLNWVKRFSSILKDLS